MSSGVAEMWDHLSIEPDEAVILSGIYETTPDAPILRCASLLIGPPAIAETGWPGWRLAEGFKPAPSPPALEAPSTFSVDLGAIWAGRVVMTQAEAYGWLRAVMERNQCEAVGGLPVAQAALAQARAPIRVGTHSHTAAGDLATWLARPIAGFHFTRIDDPADIEPESHWTVGDTEIGMPAVELLGLSSFEGSTGAEPSGLLVGRFERRAWLASQRLDLDQDLYSIQLGIEPERADLADLEIEVEEQLDDEVLFAEHLRLEDVDIREAIRRLHEPTPPGSRIEIGVRLPTFGRGIKRSVRLSHRDGALLDEWPSFNVIESISISINADGAELPPVNVGERRSPQDLVEHLGSVERVRSQYATLRREGTHLRIFDDLDEGRKELRAILERAPGEVLVLDPYFRDWDLLTNLGGPPPRVLIGSDSDPPPEGFPGKVARWRGRLAPFHDRFFLWEGGGVSVGTSAGGVRDRLYRIVRMGAAESEELRTRFALWWGDPGFEHI
ncbi:MAG TPA: hypothetical protein VNZ01_10200 [Solirubrobacteraceae bacterium]|jgi:hypothetical protein|nr:hypothetical protein [Solirubrobacteraceae bacterium]